MCMLSENRKNVVLLHRNLPKTKAILAYKQVNEFIGHDERGQAVVRFKPIASGKYPEGGWQRRITYTAHTKPRPGAGSRTGFHALKRATRRADDDEGILMVAVELWGRIYFHKGDKSHNAGYRAEYMEII